MVNLQIYIYMKRCVFFLCVVIAMLAFQTQNYAQCTPPSVVNSSGASRCGNGTVILTASPSAGSINWYAAPTGGASLSTGNSFTTPTLTTTTTYYAAASQSGGSITNGSLSTIVGGTNGCGGGVMFNITPIVDIVVDSFLNLSGSTQTTAVTVYYKLGTYVGSELNAAAWTTSGTNTITTTIGLMSIVKTGAGGITMLAGNTYGVFIANMYSRYTDGTMAATPYTNADLTLTAGAGLCGVWTSTVNAPRIFNGTVYYHKGSNCESTRVPVVATINPTPVVNLGNDTTICPGVSYSLNAGNAGATYLWNNSATTQAITTSAAGTYNVRVTTANGCIGRDTINITPGTVPQNNLSDTITQCAGDPVTLNAGNQGSTYIWTPGGSTAQVITVTNAGLYTVGIKSNTGCVITSSTEIIQRPYPTVNLGNDTSICIGDQLYLDAQNNGYSFSWNNGDTTQSIWASDSGSYSVIVTSPFGCATNDQKHISYLPSPYVEGFNFIPLFYENLGRVKFSPLNPQNTTSYEWNFGDGSAVSTSMNPEHTFDSSGTYIVTIKVINGCGSYSTSLPIHVDLTATSVATFSALKDFQIFPNPARDVVNIYNMNVGNDMEQIEVFSILGRRVASIKADGQKQLQLQTQGWGNGMYTIAIYTQKGVAVRKVEILK